MTLMNRSWKLALVAGIASLTAGAALAAPIGLNMEGRARIGDTTGFPLTSDQVAGFDSVADDNWNNLDGDSKSGASLPNLVDGDGNATPIDATVVSDGNWNTSFLGGTTGNSQMMRGHNSDQGGDNGLVVTLSEVPVGLYDLYVYSTSADGENRYSSYSITTGAVAGNSTYYAEPQTTPTFNGSGGSHWMQATNTTNTAAAMEDAGLSNYVLFEDITPDSGTIVLTIEALDSQMPDGGNTNLRSSIQGLQLVEVPEPASLALMGLGGLALLRRRRTNA